MTRALILGLFLLSIQTQASSVTRFQTTSSGGCLRSQVSFHLDGKIHCLDTDKPIIDSLNNEKVTEEPILRFISNSEEFVDVL